jgi:hypothetical protein
MYDILVGYEKKYVKELSEDSTYTRTHTPTHTPTPQGTPLKLKNTTQSAERPACLTLG